MLSLLPGDADSEFALGVIRTLSEHGFIAYLAGGCVRDALMGHAPKDYDVATNATPAAVRELFGKHRTLAIGAAFGVINVLPPARSSAQPVEVATFRSDGNYSDGRRPDSVAFGSPQADAERRDFTINGLFFDPVTKHVIDFVDGQADLAARRVRAIGVADDRFAEDKLRMLRAIRFAALFEFSLDHDTAAAVARHAGEITTVSGERIGAEMQRMLASRSAPAALQMIVSLRLAASLLPPAIAAIANAPLTLDWLAARARPDFESGLAILAAVASQSTDAEPQPDLAAAKQVLGKLFHQWKLAAQRRDAALQAIAGFPTILRADQLPWSVVQPHLVQRFASTALAVAEAFAKRTHATSKGRLAGIEFAAERLSWPRERLDPPPLIDGDALRQQGYKPGPSFRDMLAAARAAQLDGQIRTAQQAIEVAEATLRNDCR